MKRMAIILTAMSCSATLAVAGESAVNHATLQSMGFAQMQPLSDSDGMTVRGKGPLDFVFVKGFTPKVTFPKMPGNSGFSGSKLPGSPLAGSKGGFQEFGPTSFGGNAGFGGFPTGPF